jgi:hypothetical protein
VLVCAWRRLLRQPRDEVLCEESRPGTGWADLAREWEAATATAIARIRG